MAIEINTQISVGDTFGKKVGNLTLLDAKFFGRPNFSGEMDRFKDDRRKFTVLIPNDMADQLREMGWNVKTIIPTQEEKDEGRETVSCLRVMVDDGSQVFLKKADPASPPEAIKVNQFGIVDRSRFSEFSIEIRAWEYDPEENAGKYSARLVSFVGVMNPNLLADRYGTL